MIEEGKAKIEESKILCEEVLWHHFDIVRGNEVLQALPNDIMLLVTASLSDCLSVHACSGKLNFTGTP